MRPFPTPSEGWYCSLSVGTDLSCTGNRTAIWSWSRQCQSSRQSDNARETWLWIRYSPPVTKSRVKPTKSSPFTSLAAAIHESEVTFTLEERPAHKFEVIMMSVQVATSMLIAFISGSSWTRQLYSREICSVYKISNGNTSRPQKYGVWIQTISCWIPIKCMPVVFPLWKC